MARGLVLLMAVGLVCCRDRPAPPAPSALADVPEVRGAEVLTDAAAPLASEWIERLELPDGGLAYVTPPVGATERRPVIVAIHGAIDDAGLLCSAWRIIADVYPFVLCPAGSKVRKDTYVWPSSDAIERTTQRALAALEARYPDRLANGPPIYVAFSQGANLAGPVLGSKLGFARAVLTEGGYRGLDRQSARGFAKHGGDRVLFTCSQPGCETWFGSSRAALTAEGVTTRTLYAGSWGHSMLPAVRESIHEALPWIVEGLEGWQSYATHPRLPTH